MDESVLLKLRPTERRIYDKLARGELVRKRELLECLQSWSAELHATEEGKKGFNNTLAMHITNMRRLIRPHGVDITCHRNGSEENSYYALTRLLAKDRG